MASRNKYKEIPDEKLQEPEVIESVAADQEQETAKKEEAKPRKPKRTRNFFQFISFFNMMDRNKVVHAMPFILFLTALAMAYITNSFYSERTIRDIDRTKRDL